MKHLSVFLFALTSLNAFAHKATISCSTADYNCDDSICGYWLNGSPIDEKPKIVELKEVNSSLPSTWVGIYREEHNGYQAEVSIVLSKAHDSEQLKLSSSISVSKDALFAEAPGSRSEVAEHASAALRTEREGTMFDCMIKRLEPNR